MPKLSTKPVRFSPNAFEYFDIAHRQKKNKAWLEKHLDEYEEFVSKPFVALVELLHQEFSGDLPKIDFLKRRISRPLRRNRDADGGIVRTQATAYFAEKTTSQFEWNPGIYFSLGAKADDNIFALGLYMVSSRQMSRLREGLVNDFDTIEGVLGAKKLVSRWGGLSGEMYKRFPKGFDESLPTAKLLKHKQFFLSQSL